MSTQRTTIAVSGIVGAGKSSAAKAIVHALRSSGCAAEYIRFQEFAKLRISAQSSAVVHDDSAELTRSAGREEPRWRGYQRRRLTIGIAAAYVSRTVLFRCRLRQWPKETVLVFDRYFYDSLVHFDLTSAGAPLRMLVKAIPTPTIGALLLAREATVVQRRSSYSPEYARQVSEGYAALPERFPDLIVVPTDDFASVNEAASRIAATVLATVRAETD